MQLTRKIVFISCSLLLFNCFVLYSFYDELKFSIASILPGPIKPKQNFAKTTLDSYSNASLKMNVKKDNSKPFLSLHCNRGRLGNQMCSYATLYGLSLLNNRSYLPLTCNNKYLSNIFVGPNKTKSVEEKDYKKEHPWKILPYFKPEDAKIPDDSNFVNGYVYPCSYTFFDHSRDKIRQEFQFLDHLNLYAQEVLREANVHNLQNATFVAIHIRRGDYQKRWLDAYEAAPVNEEYFQEAVKYFQDKYNNTIFVAVSEDREWCKNNLSAFGVYVPKDAPSPAHDLAVIANCNHTIMTYGTYGFWGSYLAGGEVLYFDNFLKPNTSFARYDFIFDKMYPPDWKGILTIDSYYWLEKEEMKNSTTTK